MMNCDVFIPIRLANTRLPQKAMKLVNGKPIITYLIERLLFTKKIRNIIICTTTMKSDDPLVDLLEKFNVKIFRGNESDILIRYLHAAKKFETDFIVSVDGDDIYTDIDYVDEVVSTYQKTNYDYIDMIGFPFGIASVGIKTSALEKICKLKQTENTDTGYRLFFTENNIFNVYQLKAEKEIVFPKNLRLTLDYEEDLVLAKEIFKNLGNDFHLQDILKLFTKNPKLLKITSNLEEKYKEHWNKNLANTTIKNI